MGRFGCSRPTFYRETTPRAYATPAVSPLRPRIIDDMTLRNLSPATQRSYLHADAKFSRYCDRSPDRLGLEDVRAFQVYLVSQGISWPALNQTVCVLRFFYGVTLNRAEIPERIAGPAVRFMSPIIPAATGTARSVRVRPHATGWRHVRTNCCRSPISTWSSHCLPRSQR